MGVGTPLLALPCFPLASPLGSAWEPSGPLCRPGLRRKNHDNIWWTAQFSSTLGRVNFWNAPWSKEQVWGRGRLSRLDSRWVPVWRVPVQISGR